MHDEFNIVTGLFRSRAVFAIGAIGGRSTPDAANDSNSNDTIEKMEDDHALTAIPPGQGNMGCGNDKNAFADKLMQKRILRKVDIIIYKYHSDNCIKEFNIFYC